MGLDTIKKNGKLFFLDFIILKWGTGDFPRQNRNRFFKRINNWDSAPDENPKIKLTFDKDCTVTFKEILPFHLSKDECGSWLRWENIPNDEDENIKALTPIDSETDPYNAQSRGICRYIVQEGIFDFMEELAENLKMMYLYHPQSSDLPSATFQEIIFNIFGDSG